MGGFASGPSRAFASALGFVAGEGTEWGMRGFAEEGINCVVSGAINEQEGG